MCAVVDRALLARQTTVALARTGQYEAAHVILDRLIANDLVAIPRHVQWCSAVTCLADTADKTDDRAAAELLAYKLAPYASRFAVHDAEVSGPIDLALAQLALTCGDFERGSAIATTTADASRHNNTPVYLGRALVQQAAARRSMDESPSMYRALIAEAEAMAHRTGAAVITQECARYGLLTS